MKKIFLLVPVLHIIVIWNKKEVGKSLKYLLLKSL